MDVRGAGQPKAFADLRARAGKAHCRASDTQGQRRRAASEVRSSTAPDRVRAVDCGRPHAGIVVSLAGIER